MPNFSRLLQGARLIEGLDIKMEVSTAKDRVHEELEQLQEKCNKLFNTLDANGYGNLAIPENQVYLLQMQYSAMMTYLNILQYRLKSWKD